MGTPLFWYQGFTCLLCALVYSVEAAPRDDFSAQLSSFMDLSLGVQTIQNELEETSFTQSTETVNDLLQSLSTSLSTKFAARMSVVQSLKDAVESEWLNLPNELTSYHCCIPIEAEYDDEESEILDPNFQQLVDRENMCVAGLEGFDSAEPKFMNEKVMDVMTENLRQHPSIKFQYIGTEQGFTTVYPRLDSCSTTYDPRFRPWYVESATPEPKEIVIVIDTSYSMTSKHNGNSLMDIAKEAAVAVIGTLNPNDMVALVDFNTFPTKARLNSCQYNEMAPATPVNKQLLINYVLGISANGRTVYSTAINAAFDFLNNTYSSSGDNSTKRAILFLSDGAPNDDNIGILDKISERNADLGNSVAILTYGLGDNVNSAILSDMANQINNDPAAGVTTVGEFSQISDPETLRESMASFYRFFRPEEEITNPIITVPYYDAFGLGLITSICLPFYYGSDLKGVTCVDMAIGDLFSEVTYFDQSDASYAFIVGPKGRLLTHPLLPSPQSVDDDPIFLQMDALETDDEALDVMDSMLSGGSGSSTFTSLRVRSRGSSSVDGSVTEFVNSTYSWMELSSSDYSVCVVIATDIVPSEIDNLNRVSEQFPYHRLDLNGLGECDYLESEATTSTSVVKFSPAAFEDPYQYLITEETSETVEKYEEFFTSLGATNPGFKDDVHSFVTLSESFNVIITSQTAEEVLNQFVWGYLAFNAGMIRLYPGVRLEKEYDPTQRPWYKKAMASKGSIVSSFPYNDAFGAGIVVTLSKTLFAGSSNGVDEDNVVGVMGMDFTMGVFYYLMTDAFTDCEQEYTDCLIMDDGGFIVMHHDWLEDMQDRDAYSYSPKHITQVEEMVAQSLFTAGLMQKRTCINHQGHVNQQNWVMNMTADSIDLEYFTIHSIPQTNLYVVVIRSSHGVTGVGCTSNDMTSLPTCSYSYAIQCPCIRSYDFNYCTNSPTTESGYPPCAPIDNNNVEPKHFEPEENLDQCYDPRCSEKDNQRDCSLASLCYWSGKKCQELNDGTDTVLIIIIIVCGVVFICAVVLVVIKICSKPKVTLGPPTQPQTTQSGVRPYPVQARTQYPPGQAGQAAQAAQANQQRQPRPGATVQHAQNPQYPQQPQNVNRPPQFEPPPSYSEATGQTNYAPVVPSAPPDPNAYNASNYPPPPNYR